MKIPTFELQNIELRLKYREVQIWQSSLEVSPLWYNKLAAYLSEDEQLRAKRFHFEEHRVRFTVSRGLLRLLIGKYLDVSPASIEFIYGRHGKPSLVVKPELPPLNFNISHSQNVAVFAFSRDTDLGVDVEFIKPNRELMRIARRFFSKHEFTVLQSLPKSEQLNGFYNCWTRKEAFVKAVGDGLAMPLDSFSVTLKPSEPAQLLWMQGETDEVGSWTLKSWQPWENFAAAIAIRHPETRIEIMNIQQDSSGGGNWS